MLHNSAARGSHSFFNIHWAARPIATVLRSACRGAGGQPHSPPAAPPPLRPRCHLRRPSAPTAATPPASPRTATASLGPPVIYPRASAAAYRRTRANAANIAALHRLLDRRAHPGPLAAQRAARGAALTPGYAVADTDRNRQPATYRRATDAIHARAAHRSHERHRATVRVPGVHRFPCSPPPTPNRTSTPHTNNESRSTGNASHAYTSSSRRLHLLPLYSPPASTPSPHSPRLLLSCQRRTAGASTWSYTSLELHQPGAPPAWSYTSLELDQPGATPATPAWSNTSLELHQLHQPGATPAWNSTTLELHQLHQPGATPAWSSTSLELHQHGAGGVQRGQ
ncbi:unnamed protein product [Arctogadus glacialis]